VALSDTAEVMYFFHADVPKFVVNEDLSWSTIKRQPIPRERNHAAYLQGRSFMSATSMLSGTRFDPRYFGHETAAKRSLAKTAGAMVVPLGSAVLSSLCIVLISLVDYPWFAAAGFVVAYTLFWFSLSAAQLPD
jgi:hypothetical protein